MTTVAAGASQTFTAGISGVIYTVTVEGGSIGQVTGQGGPVALGPSGTRRGFGPLDAGQSITVSMQIGSANVTGADADGAQIIDPGTGLPLSTSGGVASTAYAPTVTLPSGKSTLGACLPKTALMLNRVAAGGMGLILINSDSTSLGYNGFAGMTTRGIPASLSRHLQKLGVKAHRDGFHADDNISAASMNSADPRIVPSTWTVGFNGSRYWQNTADNNAFSFTPENQFDTIYLDYVTTATAGGNMTVDVGGSILHTTDSTQTTGFHGSGAISVGALGSYTVNVKRAAGATTGSYLVGIRCYNSKNPGVLVMSVGGYGWNSGQLTNTGGIASYPSLLTYYAPDLVIAGEQINDWTASVSLATHTTNAGLFVTQAQAAGADAVLIGGPGSAAAVASFAAQDTYYEASKAAAYAAGAPFLDFRTVLGRNDGSTAAQLIYADNPGHGTTNGAGIYGRGLGIALVNALS